MFSDDSLYVELDQKSVVPGNAITGRVILELKSSQKCTIQVELGWQTTGRGNTDKDSLISKDIFTGNLEAGVHSFPFELRAPNGPFTYEGANMGLEWGVKARADIPWKIDPKARSVFKLKPGPVDGKLLYPLADGAVSSQLAQEPSGINFFIGVLGIGMIVIGAYVLFSAFMPGVVLLVVGGLLATSGLRSRLARTRLENIELTFDPIDVRGGEHVRWRASFRAKEGTVINQAKVSFACRESTISGSGKNRTTREEIVHYWEEPLVLSKGDAFEGVFEVPHFYSMSFPSNKLRWTVELHIDIAKWPDFEVASEFIVLPPLKQLTDTTHTTDEVW